MAKIETPKISKAVLWAATGKYDVNGDPVVSSSVTAELDIRREKAKTESLAPDSAGVGIGDVIMTDRELSAGDRIWFGEQDDLPDDFLTTETLYTVVGSESIPDVKGRNTQWTATLQKISNT